MIPSLLVLPYMLEQNAEAYKLFDKEIVVGVEFYKTDIQNPDLDKLIDDLEDGMVEHNIHTVLAPVAVGSWTIDHIVSDWGLSINHDSGLHKLRVDPLITEINIANGVKFPPIHDVLVDDGREIITTKLQNYGVFEYTWFLYYDGGLVIEEEVSP